MAKDPAFLFYSNDFISGTITMTNEQVGKYIRLLCYQHQNGEITAEDMQSLCGGNPDARILAKFERNENGTFFNKRLRDEMIRRAEHSKKQKENASKRWHKSGNATAMPLETETVTENRTITKNENKAENKKAQPELIFPYSSPEFMTLWNEILKEPKWRRKSHRALQASLKTLSKYPEHEAIQMIENALAGEWQGFHALNNQSKYGNKQATANNPLSDDKLLDALHRSMQKKPTNGADSFGE